jgi:hypothetical protein
MPIFIDSGIARKVAMMITGHKTENLYRRYHIVTNDDVKAAVLKIESRKATLNCSLTAVNQRESEGNQRSSEVIRTYVSY